MSLRSRGLIVGACASLALMLMPMHPAQAASCGVKGSPSYFVGYNSFSMPNVEGTSSYITANAASLYCPNGTGGRQVSVWVMLASADANSYAQIGIWRTNGPNEYRLADHVFTQKTVNNTATGTYIGSNANLAQRYAFRVLYSASCGCLEMSVDGTVKDRTPYNPFGTWGQPFSPQYLAEAYYKQDTIVGRSTNRAKFEGMGVQDLSDNVHPVPCGLSQRHDSWGVQSSGCQAFFLWGA